MLTIDLPVQAHVQKFLLATAGPNYALTTKDIYGICLNSLLTKIPSVEPSTKKYEHTFQVKIPERYYAANGMFIEKKNLYQFDKIVDKLFRQLAYIQAVMLQKSTQTAYLDTIRSFCEMYGITEDDIALDSLYRDFKRKKTQLEIGINP